MSRRFAAILLAALAAAVAALLLIHREDFPGLSRRVPRRFLRVSPVAAAPTPAAGTPAATPVETVHVTLFFPDAAGMLHTEERDIPRPTAGSAYLRALFGELQKGPTQEGLLAPLPAKIQLRPGYRPGQNIARVCGAAAAEAAGRSSPAHSLPCPPTRQTVAPRRDRAPSPQAG